LLSNKSMESAGRHASSILSTNNQLQTAGAVSPNMFSSLATLQNVKAVTFAQKYVQLLAGGLNVNVDINYEDLQTMSDPALRSLAAIACLHVVNHNLLDQSDIRCLLTYALLPFYTPIGQQVGGVFVPGAEDIAYNLMTVNNYALPRFTVTFTGRNYTPNAIRGMRAVLQAELTALVRGGGMALAPVVVPMPVAGMKNPTLSPIVVNNMMGNSMIFGLNTVDVTSFVGAFNGVLTSIQRIIDNVFDQRSRMDQLAPTFSNNLYSNNVGGISAMSIAHALVTASQDYELFPHNGIRNFRNVPIVPNSVHELNPVGALCLLYLGVTSTHVGTNGGASTYALKFVPHEPIAVPSAYKLKVMTLIRIAIYVYNTLARDTGLVVTNFHIEKTQRVIDSIVKCASIYYDLDGQDKKMIDILVREYDRYLGNPAFTNRFGNLPAVMLDTAPAMRMDQTWLGNAVTGLNTVTLPEPDDGHAEKYDAGLESGYRIHNVDVNGMEIIAAVTSANKFVEHVYIADPCVATPYTLLGSYGRMRTAVYALEDDKIEDNYIELDELLSRMEFDLRNALTIGDIAHMFNILKRTADPAKMLPDDKANVEYVRIRVKHGKFLPVSITEQKHDALELNNVSLVLDKKQYYEKQTFDLSGPVPLFYKTITGEQNINADGTLGPNAINVSFTAPICIPMRHVKAAMVSVVKDKDENLFDTKRLADGKYNLVLPSGCHLVKRMAIATRDSEAITILNKFETRDRLYP